MRSHSLGLRPTRSTEIPSAMSGCVAAVPANPRSLRVRHRSLTRAGAVEQSGGPASHHQRAGEGQCAAAGIAGPPPASPAWRQQQRCHAVAGAASQGQPGKVCSTRAWATAASGGDRHQRWQCPPAQPATPHHHNVCACGARQWQHERGVARGWSRQSHGHQRPPLHACQRRRAQLWVPLGGGSIVFGPTAGWCFSRAAHPIKDRLGARNSTHAMPAMTGTYPCAPTPACAITVQPNGLPWRACVGYGVF